MTQTQKIKMQHALLNIMNRCQNFNELNIHNQVEVLLGGIILECKRALNDEPAVRE